MQHSGLRVGVISLLAIFVFADSSQAAFSFRDRARERSPTGTWCRRALLAGVAVLGIGYFWFTSGDGKSDPAPLALEEKESGPPLEGWEEDAKPWSEALHKGHIFTATISNDQGEPLKLRLFDKNRAQKNLANIARAKNAIERPTVSLGAGPGFEVLIEKVLFSLNDKKELVIRVTSPLGELSGTHALDPFLQGKTVGVKLKTAEDLKGDSGAEARIDGTIHLTLRPKQNFVWVPSGTFRVAVEVPSFKIKENDSAGIVNAKATFVAPLIPEKPKP